MTKKQFTLAVFAVTAALSWAALFGSRSVRRGENLDVARPTKFYESLKYESLKQVDLDGEEAKRLQPVTDEADSRIEVASAPFEDAIRDAQTNPELSVLALRSNGEPAAGLEIALRHLKQDGTSESTADVVTTDSAGRASFPWGRVLMFGAHEAGLDARIAGCESPVFYFTPRTMDPGESASLPGPRGEQLSLAPPSEPVVIQLPPTAAIEVRTWIAPGEPAALKGLAVITSWGEGTPDQSRWIRAPFVSNVAHFDFVDPNGTYTVDAGMRHPWMASERVDDPIAAGTTLQVDLFPSPTTALYSARLTSGTGDLLADHRVEVGLTQPNYTTHATSDADGNVLFGLPASEPGGSRPMSIEAEGWAFSTDQQLTLDVPTASAGQRVDLGDIVLEKPATWYSGSVVNAAGAPIADAYLSLKIIKRQGMSRWLIRSVGSTRTDERGEFSLAAPSASALEHLGQPNRSLILEASVPQMGTASVAPGTEPLNDIRLVILPMREVSLLVQNMGPLEERLTVVARRLDQPDAQPLFLDRPLGSAAYRTHLPAGTWVLTLHPKSYRELPIQETASFLVTAPSTDEADSPAELALPDTSLEGRWRRAVIRFEDEQGAPVEGVQLTLTCASIRHPGRDLVDGEVKLVLPSEPVRITAAATGYAQRTFTLVGAGQTVTLEGEVK